MRNVREFKEYVMKESGVQKHFEFCELSRDHLMFWEKLNRLWDKNKVPAESVNDVDDATVLTDEQWQELEEEFNAL